MKLSTPNRFLLAGLLGGVLLLTACGDDESAQDRYCNAGEDLQDSVAALTDVDLIAEGTDGLDSALDAITDDLDTLKDAATDTAADDVDAVEAAVSDFGDALSSLGGELSSENVDGVVTAVESMASAVNGLATTLTDCG